jgi:hypothetical protein
MMMNSGWILVGLSGCQFIEEVRTDPAAISWGGTVQIDRSLSSGALAELTDGAVTMIDLDGALLEEATQPFSDNPGYWRFDAAPVGQAVAIRVSGEDVAPMVWRSTVPTGEALWFTGGLFAREPALHQSYFAALDGLDGISAVALERGTVAALWGEPLDPEEWSGVDITVTDGDGVEAPVWRLSIDDAGQLAEAGSGPVDLFIAPNLAPGIVTLEAGGAMTSWPAQGGEMLSAVFFDLEEL